MQEIFRFVLLRAPQPMEPTSFIPITEFIQRLRVARVGRDERTPRESVIEEAKAFLRENTLQINYKEEYELFYRRSQGLDESPSTSLLSVLIREIFGFEANVLIQSIEFESDKKNLSDFLHAIKITGETSGFEVKNLLLCLRAINLIESIANQLTENRENQSEFETPGVIKKYFSKRFNLLPEVFPLPAAQEGLKKTMEPTETDENIIKFKTLSEKYQLIEDTIESLMALQSSDFAEPQNTHSEPPVESNPQQIQKKRIYNGVFQRFGKFIGILPTQTISINPFPRNNNSISNELKPFTIREESIAKLDNKIADLISSYNIDLKEESVIDIVSRLEFEQEKTLKSIEKYKADELIRVVPIGNKTYYQVGTDRSSASSKPASDLDIKTLYNGRIRSVGIGDLLVVKEQIKRYEAGEIAHIENVLRGEYKERSHRRLDRTEETFVTEVEKTTDDLQELSTTERFELQNETSKILTEEVSSKSGAGFSIDTGIQGAGPGFTYYVDGNVNASIENSSTSSSQEASRKASTFSREVTNKAASRVVERKRTEQIRKVIQEIEEINKHGINNSENPEGHVIGVYQWLNKIYEAQIYNYGKRMMFDFIIPEPAAFLRFAITNGLTPEGLAVFPPDPFDLQPNQINTSNYHTYAKKYNVTGLEPSPAPFITVSVSGLQGKSPTSDSYLDLLHTLSGKIDIPDGYEPIHAYVQCHGNGITGFFPPVIEDEAKFRIQYGENEGWLDSNYLELSLSASRKRFDLNPIAESENEKIQSWSFSLQKTEGSLPYSIIAVGAFIYSISIKIKCQRSLRLYTKWKISTHDKIRQSYLNLKSEYEEKLAAAQIQAGIEIKGRNPLENRKIEKTELKKSCLAVLSEQQFGHFDSIEFSPETYPQININESLKEAKIIRFLEHAFEWEHMMYVLYPYFWSRKRTWLDRVLIEDTDPLHAEFLKAGSARVVLAVSENFESAVAHFMDTGDIPNDDELLNINSPLYKPIVEEIRERQDAIGDEIPVEESWDIKIPTTLVKLRAETDGTLPTWRKNEEGVWEPEN